MNLNEETASNTLSNLLAGERAVAGDTLPGQDPDAACAQLVEALVSADALEPTGPVAALAKIWACLKGGEIAFETESGLNFAEAKNLLLEFFSPAQVTIS